MPMTKYSIELITGQNEDGNREYVALILAHRYGRVTVADQVAFEDANELGEWLKDAVDAWC